VLVTSDNQDDAAQVAGLLKSEFGHVSESTDPETEVEDFEAFEPHVLVLAFETIEKAQSYALRLYRISRKVSAHAHRTVVLCNKDQVRTAFGLCKKGSFDDYVLYWPHAQDGLRLTMTVLSALRQMSAVAADGKLTHCVEVKVTHLGEDDGLLAVHVDPGARSGDTSDGPKGRGSQGDRQAAGLLAQHGAAVPA
jgi:hypothetical protein